MSMSTTDPHPFDLDRFVTAQRNDYETALGELRAGRKRSHWIWYIFPQVAGLGFSSMAARYAIQSRGEAEAYLAHPVLGPRLRECAEALLAHKGKSANAIMGYPDDLKLLSSMTLFAAVAEPDSVFHQVLQVFYEGGEDPKTVSFLDAHP